MLKYNFGYFLKSNKFSGLFRYFTSVKESVTENMMTNYTNFHE
jgi:hypothetical protein